MATPEPFTVHIDDEAVDDLTRRLRATRWVSDFANDDWQYGANRDYLHDLVAYWIDEYDWREHEALINAFPNYRVTLDGMPIHFIHRRGHGPSPLPIILSHGWPWTFWDLHALIEPLADPASHGGHPEDAFDVIVPSLPGFGFSSPLAIPGVDAYSTADLWVRLMRDVLGYDRFGAGGGDWGAIVSLLLGHKYAELLTGVHVTLPAFPGMNFRSVSPEDYGPDEQDWQERTMQRMQTATSHVAVHSTDPQTLAYGLNDSPVGLAAWIVERRRSWSDCADDTGHRDVERAFSRDHLLTVLSIYWYTQTIGTSMRYYYEYFHDPWRPSHDRTPAVESPTAVAVFPEELILVPRRAAERYAPIEQWTVMPAGGHFAHAEQPALVVDDLRTFFRRFRD